MERNGNIIRKENYLIQETFFVPNVFNTAYYSDKRPIYIDLLNKGEIKSATWNEVIDKLILDLRACDIATAYNAAFDFKKAIPFTEEYISNLYSVDYNKWERKQYGQCCAIADGKKWEGKNETFLEPYLELREEKFPIADLWDIACDRLINIDKYRDYCLKNSLLTASAQFFKTSAETSFQYLGKQWDFQEAHTALDDSMIEAFILTKALKKGKVEPQLGAFPFKKLGTTVDYVCDKRPKYCSLVYDLLMEYYKSLNNVTGNYAKKIEAMLMELENKC